MNEYEVTSERKEEPNFNKSTNKLQNVKSNLILKKIFDNLNKKNLLEIIKYNKNAQKRLNLSTDDYKEYCEKYSSIEIEVLLNKSKSGKYINIDDEGKEQYFHIYLNDDKKEIKIKDLNERGKIKIMKIKIKIDHQVKSFNELFNGCECIQSIHFKKFHRNNIQNMSYMFLNCLSLKEINFSQFDTTNVTHMNYMFYGCESLKELNLSNFNTNNVTNMNYMFSHCTSLKKLNLSNFNTDNVTIMSYMFSSCYSLEEINLSNFNTINVTTMSCMFYKCKSLKEINLSSFNINSKIDLSLMFYQCSSLEELTFPSFNPDKEKYFKDYMFSECSDEFKNKIKSKYENIGDKAFE